MLDRASEWHVLPNRSVLTCSAEDLVIYKLVAARPMDQVDVANVVHRQGRSLDVDRIRRWGRVFAELKEDSGLLRPFEEAVRRIRP